jgi:5-methylcytosine-specific restriction endonuclease McrA
MNKALLLNNTYEVISLISDRKALKLVYKGKVDIISEWKEVVVGLINKVIKLPAILKLKYYIKKNFSRLAFSRKMLFKRDNYQCLYCGKQLRPNQATVDHILPKCKGGISSFDNCATSCYPCNAKKGKRTLEQAQMSLITEPRTPAKYLYYLSEGDRWHPEWSNYFD